MLDFLEHVRDEFGSQVSLGQLVLQAGERKSNHIRGRDGYPCAATRRIHSCCSAVSDVVTLW